MNNKKPDIIKLERYRPTSDWFEIKEVEVDLNSEFYFEMQFRLGSWFLMHFKRDEKTGRLVSAYENDFELSRPHEAVLKLGKRIRAFTKLHECELSQHVFELMQKANALKSKEKISNPQQQ